MIKDPVGEEKQWKKMRHQASIFNQPATQAAGGLVQRYMAETRAAATRLNNASDAEALHDFRVALRRLRTHLQACRKILGKAAGRKIRNRLKRLMASTNSARDAEATIGLIRAEEHRIGAGMSAALRDLRSTLVDQVRQGRRETLTSAVPDFSSLAGKIEKRLKKIISKEPHGKFQLRKVVNKEISRCAAGFNRHLARIQSPADTAQMHKTRIWGKRLRYLLEPLSNEMPSGHKTLRKFKELQNVLGGLHDMQRLEACLAESNRKTGDSQIRRLLTDVRCREYELFRRFKRLVHNGLDVQIRNGNLEIRHSPQLLAGNS